MLLNKSAFDEIRKLPDYNTYLCYYASEIHNKSSIGSCLGSISDRNTGYMEAIFFYLQKELKPKNLDDVFNYIKEVTGVELFDGWMSPAFMEMFNYYCEKEHE